MSDTPETDAAVKRSRVAGFVEDQFAEDLERRLNNRVRVARRQYDDIRELWRERDVLRRQRAEVLEVLESYVLRLNQTGSSLVDTLFDAKTSGFDGYLTALRDAMEAGLREVGETRKRLAMLEERQLSLSVDRFVGGPSDGKLVPVHLRGEQEIRGFAKVDLPMVVDATLVPKPTFQQARYLRRGTPVGGHYWEFQGTVD